MKAFEEDEARGVVLPKACDAFSGGTALCRCEVDDCCLKTSALVSMELPHNMAWRLVRRLHPVSSHVSDARVLWIAVVRHPRTWFYSAVGQYCGHHKGGGNPGCRPGATLRTLLASGWFEPETEMAGVSHYFWHANLQTRFLGDVFLEPNWLLCAMESRFDAVRRVLRRALDVDDDRALQAFPRANAAIWTGARDFERRVPWTDVAKFYQTDLALWAKLNASGGCLAAATNAHVRDHVLLPTIGAAAFDAAALAEDLPLQVLPRKRSRSGVVSEEAPRPRR